MTKKQSFKIIIISCVISFFLYLFFGRFVAAKISTLPVLNKWNIISPQAPIVINNRQEVRVSDGTDVVEAATAAKSKLSSVVKVMGGQVTVLGNAINITSDGTFMTAQGVLPANPAGLNVVLNDGRQASVVSEVADPATGLVFFKANINNVPTAPIGSSNALNPGEKVIFLNSSPVTYAVQVVVGTVSAAESDYENAVFNADYPSRSFAAQASSPLSAGQAAVNTKGEAVGIWNGSALISSDVFKKSIDLYLGSNQSIARPYFGFSYVMLTKADAVLLGVPQGARVVNISKPTKTISAIPAAQAGMEDGDIITAVGQTDLSGGQTLEEALANYRPGDTVTFTIQRNNSQMQLTLHAAELK